MSDCIFCRIVNGDIPCSLVYEDDKVMAFKDINPLAPVHILVIPKQHLESVLDLDAGNSGIVSHIFEIINKLAVEAGISGSGFRVVTNIGADGGQLVKHLHFHVLGGRKLEASLG